jgi:glyoxylase-like metal-dependent hydrolase (beta-lactamase superfamily II)
VIWRFPVGRLNCTVISDGQMEPPLAPPLEGFFTPGSGVPGDELRAALAAEGQDRTTLACGYNCLLVQTQEGHAVIDSGLGARFLGYGPRIEPLVGRLGSGLAAAGVRSSELAAVLFTHLHQDHSRGAIWPGELAFPGASGFAHVAEVSFWSHTERSSAGDPHSETALEAIRLFGARLRSFGYGAEILPGVSTVDAAGHTPGHTAFLLDSQGERLLCTGDCFYDPLQVIHPWWGTPWDHDGERAVIARRRLLDRAAGEQLLVHSYHMPFPGIGTVRRHGDGYKWTPVHASPGLPFSGCSDSGP